MAEEFVRALARGLEVITAFDADHPALTLSEVAERTGLGRATARRFLLTLVELGYVRGDGRRFSLTPQVLRLGTAYLSGLDLPGVAQPHLERLSAQVGESTSAAVLDGPDIVYVARVATRRIMSVGITVGTRFPAHATSLGRVLLAGAVAGLDDVQRRALLGGDPLPAPTARTLTRVDDVLAELDRVAAQGWALVDGELEVGLRSLAVPLHDATGAVVAAMNVSSTSSAATLRGTLGPLRATAAAVDADLRLVTR